MKTKSLIYWMPYIGTRGITARKFLLICNEYGVADYLFDLTKMGLSHVSSYSEFKKLFPNTKPYKPKKNRNNKIRNENTKILGHY